MVKVWSQNRMSQMTIKKIWYIINCTLISLILFILLIICVTELDKVSIEKEAEYQKLEYFRTLNKIYNKS